MDINKKKINEEEMEKVTGGFEFYDLKGEMRQFKSTLVSANHNQAEEMVIVSNINHGINSAIKI